MPLKVPASAQVRTASRTKDEPFARMHRDQHRPLKIYALPAPFPGDATKSCEYSKQMEPTLPIASARIVARRRLHPRPEKKKALAVLRVGVKKWFPLFYRSPKFYAALTNSDWIWMSISLIGCLIGCLTGFSTGVSGNGELTNAHTVKALNWAVNRALTGPLIGSPS